MNKMSELQICPECGKEMKFAGKVEYGGLGYPNRLVDGYKCTSKECLGNPDYVEVSDLAGRTEIVKKSSLKPSTWMQGNEVSTHI
jgi:hypothetical protein